MTTAEQAMKAVENAWITWTVEADYEPQTPFERAVRDILVAWRAA